jgi:hypothetical protein
VSIFREFSREQFNKIIERLFSSLICERCGSNFFVEYASSRTQYEWDGEGDDPNRDIALCPLCEAEHNEFWDDMWREYNQGRL